MKKYRYIVEILLDDDFGENEALGGLCDIIRDGLNNKDYKYLKDIKVISGGKR